jgi:large exoprotein involved in heme utilization and adhesion
MELLSFISASSADVDAIGPAIDVNLRGDLLLLSNSQLIVGAFGPGSVGDIAVAAGRSVVASNVGGQGFSGISSAVFDAGAGGRIRVRARSIEIDEQSQIGSDTIGLGNAGGIDLAAVDLIRVQGANSSIGGLSSGTQTVGVGPNVAIQAGRIEVHSGGLLVARAVGTGIAGDLTVRARTLVIEGSFAGIEADGAVGPQHNGLTIDADELTVADGANVSASGFFNPPGQITIHSKHILLQGGAIQAANLASASGGTISITTDRLSLEVSPLGVGGGSIFTDTSGDGPGGAIHIVAKAISLNGNAGITSSAGDPLGGVFLETGGPGGDVIIDCDTLRMSGTSIISSATVGSAGRAGTVRVNARQHVVMHDTASVSSPSVALPTDNRGGGGGDVIVQTSLLKLDGGGRLIASSASSGQSGEVQVDADTIDIVGIGGDQVGIFSTSTVNQDRSDPKLLLSDPYGKGGLVDVRASTIQMSNSARISSRSITTADAGNVSIAATRDVILNSGSAIATSGGSFANGGNVTISAAGNLNLDSSAITAQAANNGSFAKDGGNVTLHVAGNVYLLNSTLTAEAGNNGGNITIDPQAVVLNKSKIVANAVAGNGGDISIAPDQVFLQSASSTVQSRSVSGQPGTITITQVQTDVSGALLPITNTLSSAAAQLKETCLRRLTESFSSFVIQGRGGVAPDPWGPQPDDGMEQRQ